MRKAKPVHDHDDEVTRGISADMACMKDFSTAAAQVLLAYMDNTDNAPHPPPALLVQADRVLRAMAMVSTNVDDDAAVLLTQRNIIIQAIVTGMLLGSTGITMGMLTSCDCHEAHITDADLQELLKGA